MGWAVRVSAQGSGYAHRSLGHEIERWVTNPIRRVGPAYVLLLLTWDRVGLLAVGILVAISTHGGQVSLVIIGIAIAMIVPAFLSTAP